MVHAKNIPEASGVAVEYGVPFGFAQGRLSTPFGWRLTPLRMTGLWNGFSDEQTISLNGRG
jgi:hypothetical protein